MVGATASVVLGVMNPLLAQLGAIIQRESAKIKCVHRQIVFLRDELHSMSAALEMVSESEEENPRVKEWMSQLRELSYDVEDCIEIFTHCLGNVDTCDGFIHKIINKVTTLKAHYNIGNQINELKERALEVSDRRKRYKLDPSASSPRSLVIDPRLPALFEETDRLVGIDTQMDKLVKLLTDGIDSYSQRKVVSIAGLGGLGKTTLANQILHKVRSQFDCTAFVSVTRNPNVCKVLTDTLVQFLKSSSPLTEDQNQNIAKMQENHYLKAFEYLQLVHMNREYLQNRRYFVIIDDIWAKQDWNEIQYAFPHNNKGSRIMTTTRIEDVARFCSFPHKEYIYPMKPLDGDDSKSLFLKRIFDHEDNCPLELREVTDDILRKCHGLPLAIVNIASLLATKQTTKQGWERVRNSIGSALERDHELEVVKRILSLSYHDLPHYLKICFFDLSIFPEDHVIGRHCLIRRWIAEGLIAEQRGQHLEDTAENYFSELINRNMIEPVDTDYSGRPRACRVHDIMLDLIISLSVNENFVTIAGDHNLTPPTNKIRRLSLQRNLKEQSLCLRSNSLSHVRSLSVFGDVKKMPSLLDFHVLRVLDVQYCSNLEDSDIESIGTLVHLRYLSFYSSNISKIPKQIGRLKHLQTLDLRATRIKELPATITQLCQLLRLYVSIGVVLPNGIGAMALEELLMLDASQNSPEVVQELRNLTKLKVLGFKWCADGAFNDERSLKKSLVSSFCNLGDRNLRSLRIETTERCSMDFLFDSLCPPPCYMRSTFSKLPKWISYLSELINLTIFVEHVGSRDVHVLKGLPVLRSLQIFTAEYPEETVMISPEGFQHLEDFHFRPSMYCRTKKSMLSLVFEEGAMPRLKRLWFRFVLHDTLSAYGVGFDFGISLLLSLKRLWISINCHGARVSEVETARVTIKNAAALLPNRPRHEIHIFGDEEMVKDKERR